MKNDSWDTKANELQQPADKRDAVKIVHGPFTAIFAPPRTADGTELLNDKAAVVSNT